MVRNVLLHGPKGTGKSSLPVLLGIALRRHLVHINLADYVYDLKKLETLLSEGKSSFRLSNSLLVCDEADAFFVQMKRRVRYARVMEQCKALGMSVEESEMAPLAEVKRLQTMLQGNAESDRVLICTTNELDSFNLGTCMRRFTPFHIGGMDQACMDMLCRDRYSRDWDGCDLSALVPADLIALADAHADDFDAFRAADNRVPNVPKNPLCPHCLESFCGHPRAVASVRES